MRPPAMQSQPSNGESCLLRRHRFVHQTVGNQSFGAVHSAAHLLPVKSKIMKTPELLATSIH